MGQQLRRKTDGSQSIDQPYGRFGAVAVRRGFITADQLKLALEEQVEDDVSGKEHRLVGSILFEKGWVTERQIELVLLALQIDVRQARSTAGH